MRMTSCPAYLGVLLMTLLALHGAHTATAVAREPVMPPTAPFEVVPSPADHAHVIAKLDGATEGIWLDGEVLWLAKKNSDGPWKTLGGVSQPLTRLNDSDIWMTGLRWDRWPEAFMRVAFVRSDLPAGSVEYNTWRGERAPPPPAQAEAGQVESFQLPGPVPGSERTITVVLPPAYNSEDELPAIVLADGQSAEAWGKVIAALVLEGKLRPLAVVGIHSGGYEGDRSQPYNPRLDVRAREYLDGFDQERFDAHLAWVIESVLPEASRRFTISLQRDDLAIAGFSNGGAFAASAGLRRGDVFAMALALSVGVPPEIVTRPANAPMPRFYLAAGELEHQFLHHTRVTRDRLEAAGGEAALVTFAAGHDAELWIRAMAQFMPLMFPPKQPGTDTRRHN